MMKPVILAIFLSCMFVLSHDVQAQGWWQRAKEALNSDTGKRITQSLGQETAGLTGLTSSLTGNLTNIEIDSGLREALRISTQQVVQQLGVQGGFNLDPKIHIPLPSTLARVDSALSAIGMSALTDDLELRLNRAAEAATPKAKALFLSAIQKMTLHDAKNILTGPQDAATQYLRQAMGPSLAQDMQPIADQALSSAGAVQAYDRVMGRYGQIPFMPDVKARLNDYVIEKALDGIFYYVGQEEAAIRTNPAKRTTDLLKKVFAAR